MQAMMLRLSCIAALASVAICAPGVRRISIHPHQLYAREDNSNITLNAIDFLLSLNQTLLKYDLSPLPALPGVVPTSDLDNSTSNPRKKPSVVETREATPLLTSHTLSKRDGLPASAVNLPDVGAWGHLRLGKTHAGSGMSDIPTVFDTGAPVYTVPGILCTEDKGCKGPIRYLETGRDTGVDDNLGFVTVNSLQGHDFVDSVTVGGHTVDRVTVQSIRSGSGLIEAGLQTAAVMGLARKGVRGQTSYWQAITRDKTFDATELSFFFGRRDDGNEADSELMLGGRNSDRFEGTPITVPLIQPEGKKWLVRLDNVAGPDDIELSKVLAVGTAVIDTGSSAMLFPAAVARDIIRSLTRRSVEFVHTRPNGAGYFIYVVPCDEKLDFSLYMAGSRFRLDPRDMITARVDAAMMGSIVDQAPQGMFDNDSLKWCAMQVIGTTEQTEQYDFLIGQPLLKSYYSTFSDEGITLAKSKPR